MSKIKTLSQQFPELSLSLLDAIKIVDPSGDKRTYCELFSKLLKKKYESHSENTREYYLDLKERIDIDELSFKFDNPLWVRLLSEYIREVIGVDTINNIKKLHQYRERKLINTDISEYNSLEKIMEDLSVADLKLISFENEKCVHKVFEDQEWILVRPLTHESSQKYGSNTKWCTTSIESEYFYKYCRGFLLYIINKKTGLKVGCHADLEKGKYYNLSFWNQRDEKTDSMDTGLSLEILGMVKKELVENNISNYELSKLNGVLPKFEETLNPVRYCDRPIAINMDQYYGGVDVA